jgi:hypothetical protein
VGQYAALNPFGQYLTNISANPEIRCILATQLMTCNSYLGGPIDWMNYAIDLRQAMEASAMLSTLPQRRTYSPVCCWWWMA